MAVIVGKVFDIAPVEGGLDFKLQEHIVIEIIAWRGFDSELMQIFPGVVADGGQYSHCRRDIVDLMGIGIVPSG